MNNKIKITLGNHKNPEWYSSILTIDFLDKFNSELGRIANKLCDIHIKQSTLDWGETCLNTFSSYLDLTHEIESVDKYVFIFMGTVETVRIAFEELLDIFILGLNDWLLTQISEILLIEDNLSVSSECIVYDTNAENKRYCINQITIRTDKGSIWGETFRRAYGMPLSQFPSEARISFFLAHLRRKTKNLPWSFSCYLNAEWTAKEFASESLFGVEYMTWTIPLYLDFSILS